MQANLGDILPKDKLNNDIKSIFIVKTYIDHKTQSQQHTKVIV